MNFISAFSLNNFLNEGRHILNKVSLSQKYFFKKASSFNLNALIILILVIISLSFKPTKELLLLSIFFLTFYLFINKI